MFPLQRGWRAGSQTEQVQVVCYPFLKPPSIMTLNHQDLQLEGIENWVLGVTYGDQMSMRNDMDIGGSGRGRSVSYSINMHLTVRQ